MRLFCSRNGHQHRLLLSAADGRYGRHFHRRRQHDRRRGIAVAQVPGIAARLRADAHPDGHHGHEVDALFVRGSDGKLTSCFYFFWVPQRSGLCLEFGRRIGRIGHERTQLGRRQ